MFKSYLKVAIRNLLKSKVYSFINIFGLALGIYVCLIIGLYVYDDLSFDRFHKDGDQIYRVVSFDNTRDWISAVTSGPMLLKLGEDIPEIEASTRISRNFVRLQPGEIDPATDSLAIVRIGYLTGPAFFNVFDIDIIQGNKENPLDDPLGIFVSEQTAETLYPDENPIGKAVNSPLIEGAYIAGVFNNPPRNSLMQFHVIAYLDPTLNPMWWDSWENLALTGFVKLKEGSDLRQVEQKVVASSREGGFSEVFTPKLQPLLDMHLGSMDIRYDAFNVNKNSKAVVYGLLMIGILVMIVASINFVNLSIARSVKRAREVGMRKIVGASRKQLGIQFILESVVITFLAMIIAVSAVELSISSLTLFLNKSLTLDFASNPILLVILLISGLLVGVLSGFYPAMILSSFKPVKVLKAKFSSSSSGNGLRKILVLGQFSVSIALIAGVLIVLQQIDYLQTRDFGFRKQGILVVPTNLENVTPSNDIFKERLLQIPGVEAVGRGSLVPGRTLPTTEVHYDMRKSDVGNMFEQFMVDQDFIPTLDIEIVKGRNFSSDFASDSMAVLINETAYNKSGWDDIEGKQIINRGASATDVAFNVIGVFKDIHFGVASRIIEPMLLKFNSQNSNLAMVRLERANDEDVIDRIGEVYEELHPEREFREFPMEDVFADQFNGNVSFARNIAVFASLAIIIACLGLFGLASYAVEVRQKELAIRKVMGSSIARLLYLLSREFSQWVILSNILAWPLAYFFMQKWLNDFAYRTEITIIPFVIAGFSTLVVSLITIILKMYKVARANPVDVLKCGTE